MDRFVLRGSSGRKAPPPQSNEQVETLEKRNKKKKVPSKSTNNVRKRQVPLKQDIAESDKENQKTSHETLIVQAPFPDDIEDIGSQVVIWKDNPTISHHPDNMQLAKDYTTTFIQNDQPLEPNTCHETTQDMGFSSPELFQFWKRYGVSRLHFRKKSRQEKRGLSCIEKKEDEVSNVDRMISVQSDNNSNTIAGHSLEHREETISSLLDEEECEELAPDVVLSLEEWFRKYEQQIVGPTEASSDRLRVVEVNENEANRTKLLHLNQVTDECKSLSVLLCDQWYNTNVYQGDIVRIIRIDENNLFQSFPKESSDLQIRIDKNQNFFILRPDSLISATCLSNSFTCMRRAVLADWNRFAGVDSISALEGAMIHSLIETGLVFVSNREIHQKKNGSFIPSLLSTLMEQVNSIVDAQLENLYQLSVDDQDIRNLLHVFVPQIVKWLEHNVIRPDPSLSMECYGMGNVKTSHVRLMKADTIEETIWSPIWGLKGKIDAIFQIETEKDKLQQVPFELKTVNEHHSLTPSIAHRAQLLLYSLMLSDRNDQSCDKGLLSYFIRETQRNGKATSQQTVLIATTRAEIVGLLMTRNQLVRYDAIEPEPIFPPLLKVCHVHSMRRAIIHVSNVSNLRGYAKNAVLQAVV